MSAAETLAGLRTAFSFAREQRDQAESPIDEMRWADWMRTYADDIAVLVADSDLFEMAGAR